MNTWKETHRATVFPSQCDHYGHMNVRFYVDNFDDSIFQVWPVLGITPGVFAAENASPVAARYSVEYSNELAAGDMLVVTAGITRIGNKSVTHVHRMHNVDSGALCATMTCVEVLFDTRTRKSAAMPDAIRTQLESVRIDVEEPAPHPAAPADTGFTGGQWHDTHRGVVFPWRCDHYGHMNARFYAHHFDDAGFHLFAMAGVKVAGLVKRGIALVTARTEINYIHELVAGDLFVIRGGFSHVGDKSMRRLHRLYDVESDRLCATMEATDVCFDLQARRAVPVPEDTRDALIANLVDTS